MAPVEVIFRRKQCIELVGYETNPLGLNEVRGRTIVSLISPGTELALANSDKFPIRPGYAAVFEVDEIGAKVSGVSRRDRLFCMGPHRSHQQFDIHDTLPVPDTITSEKAVIARLMGVSMTTLMTTSARPGEKVIVCGAGPVGFLAAHQFQLAGYNVYVVDRNEKRRVQIVASGIGNAFPLIPLGDAGLYGNIALVVDCTGNEQAILDACKMVRKRGEVVLVGVPWRAQTSILAHDILNVVFRNFVILRSGWEWEFPLHSRGFVWEELYQGYNNAQHSIFGGYERALNWLSQNRIPLEGLIKKTSPLDPASTYRSLARKEIDEPFVLFDWRALS